ncbi:MAG: DUF6273 domain-containing protein [Chitinispirillales bacterium]|nr:DUF6273 domain-containing protein [Chitinispirillales bacterium]
MPALGRRLDKQRKKAITVLTRNVSTALRERRYSRDPVVRTWWWLRSPGNNSNNAAYVNNDGNVNMNGNNTFRESGGVRPALPHA